MVVCVTDAWVGAETLDSIREMTGNPEIAISFVKYSFNQLRQTQERITELMIYVKNEDALIEPQYEVIKSISSTFTDEQNNVLVVQIQNLNDEKRDAFSRIFLDTYCIKIEEGYSNISTISWEPGRQIFNVNGGSFSTGYPVYFTNSSGVRVRGFITAGHALNSTLNVYRANSTSSTFLLGSRVRYQFSGNTDATLVQITDSSYTISSTTGIGMPLASNMYSLPAQGTVVYKEGANTGLTVGVVNATSHTVNYGTVVITDLINTSALNLGGDSGGVMYISTSGTYSIIGSMSGSAYNGASLTQSTFLSSHVSKVGNALSALNCSIW